MLVFATVGVHRPSVRREVRFRAPALHVKYIDWHVSCASFSNPTAITLWRSLVTIILPTPLVVIQPPFRLAGLAVVLGASLTSKREPRRRLEEGD